jgi:tetratricopeptide (TPR) repeat protein
MMSLRCGLLAQTAVLLLAPLLVTTTAFGQAQSKLDQATDLKFRAKTIGELGEVIELTEAAIKEGLPAGDEKFAKQLITSTLIQRAVLYAKPIEQKPTPKNWRSFRDSSLADLKKAIEHAPDNANAHEMVLRLSGLPGGDPELALASTNELVRIFKDDPEKHAAALMVRARLRKEPKEKLEDLNAILADQPENTSALLMRGGVKLAMEDEAAAIDDFEKVLEIEPENAQTMVAMGEALVRAGSKEKGMEYISKAVKLHSDKPIVYLKRAQVELFIGEKDKALADVNKAFELAKDNPEDRLEIRFQRASLLNQLGKFAEAEKDCNAILEEKPENPRVLYVRSVAQASQGEFDAAIKDVQNILKDNPNDLPVRVQLARYYTANKEIPKAIETFDTIVEDFPGNLSGLRGRADALLSIGQQKEAIADYEAILQKQSSNIAVLNNLAWVLATSPDDSIRNGARAVSLAKEANDATEYKSAHLMSTLAASYAETGDFAKALEYAEKALTTAEGKLKDQVVNEIASYKAEKPWRELKSAEDQPDFEPPTPSDVKPATPLPPETGTDDKEDKPDINLDDLNFDDLKLDP